MKTKNFERISEFVWECLIRIEKYARRKAEKNVSNHPPMERHRKDTERAKTPSNFVVTLQPDYGTIER